MSERIADPGSPEYSITMWYKRHECGLRMAIFFSAATAAGAFGGLLAFGIMRMRGVADLGGWAWIFILEGIATFIIGMFHPNLALLCATILCV